MVTAMGDVDTAEAVAGAIRANRGSRTQEWLGAAVAKVEGRAEVYGQNTVAGWESGRYALKPPKVFAIERALELPPGTISRLAGYLPVDTSEARKVADVIDADPGLSPEQKEDLLAVYDGMVARTRARRREQRRRTGR